MIHRSDPSTKLDTLNHKRLFWTAFAQSWCGKNRRRVAQLNLITDVHSPDKFRIIGPLSQNVHFANVRPASPPPHTDKPPHSPRRILTARSDRP